MNNIKLNVTLLRKRVPNLTTAARSVGLRPATVSNLCTGKTPIGNAEVKTLVTLAQLAGCSLDELIIYQDGNRVIETGIKVLDLFAPIVLGGIIGLVARLGSGQISMAAELCYRMNLNGYVTILWKPDTDEARIRSILNSAKISCSSLDEIYKCILSLQPEQKVLIVADRSSVISGELGILREQIEKCITYAVTTVLIDVMGEAIDEDVPYGPLDTILKFDITLSKRGMYPAIDPVYSSSTAVEGDMLEETHFSIQQRARRLLRRYRELDILVNMQGEKILREKDTITYKRGKRLEAFLTQPTYVAELVTQKNGEWVEVQETINNVRRILDGDFDNIEPKLLSYIGRLPDSDNI
jgi:F-type H+-transporting ATPase subunit beta